ncbi:MAG: zinc-ribbon domain-containing protein [Acidobacteriota bacterium]|nr:zinc-ribbon domain-containing protein [Acidobacteriota bacterium]
MQCPKCGTEARDVARFCPRCHATLRFECPTCHHEQRQGGQCEKCGVDFMKYITAVVAVKKAASEATHSKIEERSSALRNLVMLPFNMGLPLIRNLLGGSRKNSR